MPTTFPVWHEWSAPYPDETTAAAIRKTYNESGELSAVVELGRHFPSITDNENARL